jgi:hypothetical protein
MGGEGLWICHSTEGQMVKDFSKTNGHTCANMRFSLLRPLECEQGVLLLYYFGLFQKIPLMEYTGID